MALALGLALAGGNVPAAVAQADPAPLTLVIQRLEAEGYQVVETHRSWFGRLVVISTRNGMLRELVLNRTTGAILSDRLFVQSDAPTPAPGGNGGSDGQNSGGGAKPQSDGPDKGAQQRPGGSTAGRG